MLQLVSRHVIENQEIGFKTFSAELQRVVGLHWQCYYMLGNTTKLSMHAVSSSGVVVILAFLGLGLHVTVTEISIKKVQKQDLKNVKGRRDGMPKSMQTR